MSEFSEGFKKYKTLMVITSIVILLPIIVGLILWKKLPDEMPTHFGGNNEVDGWSSKGFAVIGLPLIMLCLHWLCFAVMQVDPKRKNFNFKIMNLVLWIVPACSLICSLSSYVVGLGGKFNVGLVVNIFIGVLFMLIGNYLPKCKQTYTIGIRVPWTLDDEENWNKTHRLAGFIWFIAGIVILANVFINNNFVMMGAIITAVVIPIMYSFLFSIRKNKEQF